MSKPVGPVPSASRRTLMISALSATALAACGGGGGADDADTSTSTGSSSTGPTVASLQFRTTEASAFVGDVKNGQQYQVTARNLQSQTIENPPLTWASGNSGVASVSAAGEIQALAVGATTITVSSGGASAALPMMVRAYPSTVDELLPAFPLRATSVNGFSVHSDISETFTQRKLDNLDRVWAYMTGFFGNAPKPYNFFYTTDSALLIDHVGRLTEPVPSPIPFQVEIEVPRAAGNDLLFMRSVDSWDNLWQQHVLSERFLAGLAPGAETWGWLSEGLALYFEACTFSTDGTFVAPETLRQQVVAEFKSKLPDSLIPLDELVMLEYGQLSTNYARAAYAATGVFMLYLFKVYGEGLLRQLLAQVGVLGSQAAVNAYLLAQTSKASFSEFEDAYRSFGATLQ